MELGISPESRMVRRHRQDRGMGSDTETFPLDSTYPLVILNVEYLVTEFKVEVGVGIIDTPEVVQ